MRKFDPQSYWKFRHVKATGTGMDKVLLAILVVAGLASMGSLFNWWFRAEHISSLPLFILLSLILWWGMMRMAILWVSYLGISIPVRKKIRNRQLRVAIFTTSSPGEPLSMFEKTLEACSRIEYPHTTYLLDDTGDPRFREVAMRYGAVWMELVGYPGAKAGKINEALKRTHEEYILVLDPDHVPFPNFLDEVLGQFEDERVGFVQVSQAYYNQSASFTARAAAEQTYGFYGPTQLGMNGFNCAVAIGANCTFRRKALESIGGHGVGLAEDLVTSIRIHGKGWRSVYLPVIVSRGLVPEDMGSFCKQQLKWSRGVHEVLFAELPKNWKGLTFWQRLSYFTIGTYYMSGLTMLLFLAFPYLYLFFGVLPADMDFIDFLLHWVPVAIFGIGIYLYVQRWFCDPESEKGLNWRGMFMKFASWPVFLRGFLLSLVNKEIPYIPTSKNAVAGLTPFALPLFIHQAIFAVMVSVVVVKRMYFTPEASRAMTSIDTWGMVVFACIGFIMTIGGLYAALESRKIKTRDPWENIPLNKIGTDKKRVGEIKQKELV